MFDISLVRYMPKDTRLSFIKFRYVAACVSMMCILISIVLFTTKNLNYGIDFTGGTVWEFALEEKKEDDNKKEGKAPLSLVEQIESIRTLSNDLGLGNVALQTIEQTGGKNQAIRLTIEKQPKPEGAENDDAAQQAALNKVQNAVKEQYPQTRTLSVQVLGTKVSGELRQKGITAIVLALVLVLFYIWWRFEWQFGLGAVLALAHDVVLTIGVFSLTRLEFNLSIIAAILTIVGYSLNDTVIVYDRIRENLRKYKRMPLSEILDLSINDTLSRTIMTSTSTLLALIALYIWGGEGLRGFAFAMIWGVCVGTYSSIFVASPLLKAFRLARPLAEKG